MVDCCENPFTLEELNFLDVEVDHSLFLDLPPDASVKDFSNPSPDLVSLLDLSPDVSVQNFSNPSPDSVNQFSNPSPSPDLVTLSVDDIEQFLMKDDDNNDETGMEVLDDELSNDFLSDILLDLPVDECDGSGEISDGCKNLKSLGEEGRKNLKSLEEEEEGKKNSKSEEEEEKNDAGDDKNGEDPNSKKRKRKLKNRDAAVRSRERKKMYVRDLEIKSRYFEGECKRLWWLLQSLSAENQALRLSSQNSKIFDASMTKQESAVLFLESLLLGSLLWLMGIMCLLILPRPLWSSPEAVPLENADNKSQGGLARRKAGSKNFRILVFQSFMMGKRCKASRSRMRPSAPLTLEILV